MNILTFFYSIFSKKKKVECLNDDYCPIYLSYLDKDGSSQLKYCKNANKQFCKKYRLYDEDEWKKWIKSKK